ncbi:BREX-1 system phosphatase PglZ type A [Desulfallas sp. Bu1-1]|uniref:BREX-1 system phosphatase PglZ type A n=1 Tax=Desulfallas sp. Bu1-1 TaxID=2787620 RepID=UPI00189F9714|nr:BREX-1 system phosphatase PglZ type A [Desulfallas sp. Bu1-1]MBF7082784.1 BREX-1 system phosphatase PglZ type A [Desulfallas sp. Bu1-1]
MNLGEVKKVLDGMLNQEPSDGRRRNIVFWYDDNAEFEEEIKELQLDNAKIIKLTASNCFAVKYRLEKADPESNYLIYCPAPKPVPRENWLLDTLKYSREFSTDKTTVIMRDLGVRDASLRNVFKKYAKFFNNKERYNKFASYNIQDYTEKKVDIAVLSVLCRLPVPDLGTVVKTILMAETNGENKYMEAVEKFGDPDTFWRLMKDAYGYDLAERNIEKLLVMFLVTHLSYDLSVEIPETWRKYISKRQAEVVVFVNHFMHHATHGQVFNRLANWVENLLNLQEYISNWDIEHFIKCDTFKVFDEVIITRLINNLIMDVGEFEKYRKIINNRKPTHWFELFKDEYDLLYNAMEILRLEKELNKTIKGQRAYELLDSYTREYYLLDYFYRKFYTAYDRIENKEPFGQLCEKVENTYTHWFLNELSVKWAAALQQEPPGEWRLQGASPQDGFYLEYIARHLRKGERVFVIISDALRYEAAREFSNILNTERKGATRIFHLLGVLPSCTKLGMAALLPHKSIEYNDKAEVLVDGTNVQGIEGRRRVLLNYNEDAVAVAYNEIKDIKRQEFKDYFEGKKLIYIYHNGIDAVGDHAATEREVFNAVEKSITDLRQLIKNLVNNLSATHIYITADHGFIYRRSALQECDKIPRPAGEALEVGKRFMLTDENKDFEGTLAFSMRYILGKDINLKVVVPRGVNIFKIQGAGVNYLHGGASLQEIVIPVIKFKNDRSKSDALAVKKVEVKLTNISRKITNRITYLEFFQVQKVEDKYVPIRLKIYFTDEEGRRISNENIIIAESRSARPEERTFREKFTLRDMPYDKGKKYYLVLEDEDEPVERIYQKIPFVIDLAIVSGFDF